MSTDREVLQFVYEMLKGYLDKHEVVPALEYEAGPPAVRFDPSECRDCGRYQDECVCGRRPVVPPITQKSGTWEHQQSLAAEAANEIASAAATKQFILEVNRRLGCTCNPLSNNYPADEEDASWHYATCVRYKNLQNGVKDDISTNQD